MRNTVFSIAAAASLFVGACATNIEGTGDPADEGGGEYEDVDTGGCIEGPCQEEPDPGDGDVTDPVDAACAGDTPVDAPDLFVPKWTPLPPTVPNDCLRGFEMNRLRQHVHTISSAAGSRAITLEVDIATYTASDAIRISAVDGAGNATILVDTCRLRTAEYGDPTGGTVRPPEDSIRDFRVNMPAGTKQLVVDNSNASTPTYIRVLGLCDFDLAPVPTPTTTFQASWYRVVTSR